MTQEQLAIASAMDRSVLIGVELGHRSTVFERLFDIADGLNVSVVELLVDG